MASLQRSNVSFRRQGSSGLVWEDKYLLEEDGFVALRHLRPSHSTRERPTANDTTDAIAAFSRSFSTPLKNRSSLLHHLFRPENSEAEKEGNHNRPHLPAAAPMSSNSRY